MRSIRKRILSIFLAMMLLPIAALAEGSDEANEVDETDETSQPIYVLDYFNGTALDLTQYEGKAIYLNFFEGWCQYCMEEMPDLKKIYDLYDPQSLVMILVHPWNGEDETDSAKVVETYGLEGLTLVEDTDSAIETLVGVPGYPTSIFIGADGYLYYAVASMLEYDDFVTIFDGMGIPLRDGVEPAATATPSPSGAATDALSGATAVN
jgi:thiol-disulfide isomerase/thioredoxin